MNKGNIIQIMGPVVDMRFEGGELPALYNAINLKSPQGENETIVCEVAQHLGDNSVRTVSMHPTDGLVRGQEAIDTSRDWHDKGRKTTNRGDNIQPYSGDSRCSQAAVSISLD